MGNQGLTTFALVFMILSMGGVTVLATYCFYRILRGSQKGTRAAETESGHQLKL
jgi:hypothetical protein